MSVQEQIRSSLPLQTSLLSTLRETDHSIPDHKQQLLYITDLSSQLSTLTTKLKALDKVREKEKKEHISYRDSVFKRFAYKSTGRREKFEQRAEKEEKDYFDNLRETQLLQDQIKQLSSLLDDAKSTETQLKGLVDQHNAAQRELDQLYDSIFSGQTPKYPDEDVLESQSNDALSSYHSTRQAVEAEQQVKSLLEQASRAMRLSLNHLSSAEGYSTWDMWGGGTMSDMMERNELSSADRQWASVQMLTQQAKHLSGYVRDLPAVKVAMGNIMSDVFFDNIFTDMAFHEKIKQSQYEMNVAADVVERNRQENEIRLNGLGGELRGKEDRLERTRRELQELRSEIFRKVGEQEAGQK
ncbi:hypothetical protein I302_107478 [Kwoniella bestiolae CBS 10118]|uniref:Uncharacterized protein n=1 Tax=Kwoniella bestiolae CBS 10118 TaxID=1296100 RepID=A0A1B9FYE8_9TREE|nr:hypothetical protein I302_06781 [Kwoniella bestiolae CBS 10118]OCF23797.1 hypothetical protein I302_06781 [Kwoniella bestiolae CBS 10118]